jgi:hypothetical protein
MLKGAVRLGIALGVAFARLAGADTVVAITDIGTSVQSSGFTIATHVDQVVYSPPAVVDVPGYGAAYEIRGMVSGVGWGGTGAVARAANRHYSYDIPFVARWPLHGAHRTELVFHHGGGPTVVAMLQADKLSGAANMNRATEDAGGYLVDVPALFDHCAYVSFNRRSMHRDGTFSAKYLPSEVPPLTQAEVDGINAVLTASPGTAGYTNPDIAAGLPVPAAISTDTATARDVNRALARVVADAAGTHFDLRLSIGTSAGSVVTSGLVFGASAIGTLTVRTGGNYVVPYQPSSGKIFDGFIMNGFVYNSATQRADADFPLSAPVFFLQGRADERYEQPMAMLAELGQKGVTLDGSTWVYEIENLPHVPADNLAALPPDRHNGDRMGAFYGAAIANLRALLQDGVAPPTSRIAGRIDASGALVIDVAGGAVETVAPIREDPTLDTSPPDPQVTPRTIGPAETAHWEYVTARLPFVNDAIAGPSIACRAGAYAIHFFGANISPFAPDVLDGLYGCFDAFRDCVSADVASLAAERLYDARVESAHEAAAQFEPLFETLRCEATSD